MSRDFVGALLQLNAEKQVPQEALIRAVEEGIQAAYRRVAGEEDIFVNIEPTTGEIRVFRGRYVVDEVEDPLVEVTVEEAQATRPGAAAGEVIELEQLDGEHFGRIGAQTAKQIILQRMREVERDLVFDQFANREGDLLTGPVSRVEPRAIILDVGKGVEAVLATSEQSPLEHYRIGQPVKAYVLEVRRSARGPQILVSRTHKGFLRRLFELEVPEIHAGTVEIKALAREAGSRSKVAVASRQEGLDPVGATVGQRGARVQAVVAELGGEKIDVIPWNEDPSVFVANALSPAQVLGVEVDEEHRVASVTVPERMLSLAIGREGQNARLAARLTGWRIDIRSDVPADAADGAERSSTRPAPAAEEGSSPEAKAESAPGEMEPASTESVAIPAADETPAAPAADEAATVPPAEAPVTAPAAGDTEATEAEPASRAAAARSAGTSTTEAGAKDPKSAAKSTRKSTTEAGAKDPKSAAKSTKKSTAKAAASTTKATAKSTTRSTASTTKATTKDTTKATASPAKSAAKGTTKSPAKSTTTTRRARAKTSEEVSS